MIKRILTAVVFVFALAISAFFTWLNPGEVRLDLGFATFETPLGLAFVLAIAAGWVLGILCALFWVARISVERRRLRAELKSASAGGLAVRDERR
jgi:uncharacterized integral membrane protein